MEKPIRIGGVPEHFNLPWHQAIDSHAFLKNNLEVRWTDYPGGTGTLCQALRQDELDIAVSLTEGTIQDICAGNPSRLLQCYVASPLHWGIFVSAKSSIHSVEAIHDKKFAISRFRSGSHIMALVNASNHQQVINDDQFVVVNNLQGAREALSSGQADIFLWEKYMTKPLVDSGEFRMIGECLTPWPCFVIAASNKFITERGDVIPLLLDIISEACASMISDPLTPQVISHRYGLQLKDAQSWLRELSYVPRPAFSEEDLRLILHRLQQLNIIDSIPLLSNLVYQPTFEPAGSYLPEY